LLDDEYVAILSSDNPASDEGALSVECFAALPHIAISSGGEELGFIDAALADRGLARKISATVPLHSLIMMLIGSEALAVVPRRIAADVTSMLPLTMRCLPFPSSRLALSMIWHRRLNDDPAHRWLRGMLRTAVNENSGPSGPNDHRPMPLKSWPSGRRSHYESTACTIAQTA
jgi:DNA-binding transcriptional LysR family regulator